MSLKDTFSGLRLSFFPRDYLSEFWKSVSSALMYLALVIALWLGYAGVRIASSYTWNTTEIVQETASASRADYNHAFAYIVNGKQYGGSRYFFGGNSFSNRIPSDKIVYYNPAHPERSVIHRRFSSSQGAYLLLLLGALAARRYVHRNYAN